MGPKSPKCWPQASAGDYKVAQPPYLADKGPEGASSASTINISLPLRVGKGIFAYKNGDLYTGRFDNDEFNGRGKIQFGSLDVYEGEFSDGRLEGHGLMEYTVRKVIVQN